MSSDVRKDTPEPVAVTEDGTDKIVKAGDSANKAVRVNMVAGSLSVTATTTAHATAAAPTLVEGSDNPLSADLSGNLRTLATATTAAKATAADPTYVEGSTSPISQDLSGHLRVAIGSIALPTGASTAAKQDTGNSSLASIDSKLTNPLPVSGPLTDTQLRASAVPVSAAALPLPSNAAKETGGNLDSLVAKDFATQTTLALIKTDVDKIPTNPATDRTTAAAPFAVRSSDGSAFFDPRNVLEDATNTVVQPGDATNKAIRVNVVASTGSTTFFGITESSTGDGSTTTLTLGHTPTDEPRVFVDRIRQVLGTDYTRAGAVITWITIPGSGAPIQVDYTWSLASATLASTLVVDQSGHVQPTGDAAARSIHVTVDTAPTLQVQLIDALSRLANVTNSSSLQVEDSQRQRAILEQQQLDGKDTEFLAMAQSYREKRTAFTDRRGQGGQRGIR